ncbi:MAG TPA: hypothetical protein VK506_07510, partial [Conexibacter sp.]|nr:hypothetical protein [Conexibacter sp.]
MFAVAGHDDRMSRQSETEERAVEDDHVAASVCDARTENEGGFVLRDASFRGRGGGAPGVNPDDWMS